MTKKCLQPGCGCQVEPPELMCSPHWGALPGRIKRKAKQRLRSSYPDLAVVYLLAHIHALAASKAMAARLARAKLTRPREMSK
jgi:hypothetical protein